MGCGIHGYKHLCREDIEVWCFGTLNIELDFAQGRASRTLSHAHVNASIFSDGSGDLQAATGKDYMASAYITVTKAEWEEMGGIFIFTNEVTPTSALETTTEPRFS